MKVGRNDPCPCDSGKKYKHCCIHTASEQHLALRDELAAVLAMNPDLTFDELNLVAEKYVNKSNNQGHPDFCGLSPNLMHNWLNAPFKELDRVSISTPSDLSSSPVMRYLELILDEAMQQGGSFKATTRGNLPAKLAKNASVLLPEFAVAKHNTNITISDYMGNNEGKINALHYTRVLADIAGIIYLRSGRFHIKKTAQKQYKKAGIQAFFLPMLEAATTQYNWRYLDGWEDSTDLREFWLFMLWRLQSHASINKLSEEVAVAFPQLLGQLPESIYSSPEQMLTRIIEVRFITRFLEYWGFLIASPLRFTETGKLLPTSIEIQPLLNQTFQFKI